MSRNTARTKLLESRTTESQAATAPGRSCPLHYRYAPRSLARPAEIECETLYVVGGLYGNEAALNKVIELFDREVGNKRLVFNGDFNWFNVDAASFESINHRVMGFDALRGNVETELGDDASSEDSGCGCAYPDWVDSGVVDRSNRIMRRLRATAAQFPELQRGLAALPMTLRVDVGNPKVGDPNVGHPNERGVRVAVVHGDAQSLAGWGFAQESLRSSAHRQLVRGWFDAAEVDVFASSHTCAPVFQALPMAGRAMTPVVLNNGAAGMPNFSHDAAGLLSRISLRPFQGPERRYGETRGAVHLDAIAINFDAACFQDYFLRQWPQGSDAHASYWQRIQHGPVCKLADAFSSMET